MVAFLKYVLLKIKEIFYRLYLNIKQKFTLNYWKQKSIEIKQYDWKRNGLGDIFKIGWRFLFLIIKIGVFFFIIVYLGLLGRMPSQKELKAHQNSVASEVYSSDSVLLGRYFIQDRTNVEYKDISPEVVKALVATEDARFYEHKGIDSRSLARVIIKSILLQEESSGGGSTISQQLAKNLYPRQNYWIFTTPVNKLQEMIIARRIETIYNKDEVLELYLNTVPLGGNLFGIERAALRFFDKHAKTLKTEEAAVLIGMLKATTTYNPRLNPEKSKLRRNVVLNQMVKYNKLDPQKAEVLKKKPLTLRYNYKSHSEGLAPYFREHLRLELVKWCATFEKENGDPVNLYTDGLKIYTTINSEMQKHAEKAVRRRMSLLQKEFETHWKGQSPWGKDGSILKNAMVKSTRYKKLKNAGASEEEIEEVFQQPVAMEVFNWKGSTKRTMSPMDSLRYYQKFLNTGLISIEPKTGYVKAWVGGINHEVFKYDHVLSKRQVGSTFKPIVYAAALEKGIEPCTYFENKLISYPEYKNWTPQNAGGQYGGKYSMKGALAHSINTVSTQILMQTGIKPTIELARKMGIAAKLPEVPSISLGVANISLFEMVSAYTTFANEGYHVKPIYITKILDRKGKVLRQEDPEFGKKAMAIQNAQIMLNLMQGVIEEGSGARLRSQFGLQIDIAGKTGTTQDQADGWFIGITPELVTGVWVGAENPKVRFRTLALGQGANTALPIWGEYMLSLLRDKDFRNFASLRFPLLPPQILDQLDCESFIEEEKMDNFLDRFFNNIFSEPKDNEERKKELEKKDREREERWEAYRRAKEKQKRERKERKKKRKRENGLFNF